jgi:mannosyltransferase
MGKKREDREKGSKSQTNPDASLDGDFISPIHSLQDLTAENIGNVLKNSRYTQIILAMTVLGLFLRLYHLDYNSLWLDEASTLMVSKTSLLEIWQISLSGEFHPPLFHWITHLMLTFGQCEAILRLVPAVLGTLTIPVFYLIGKELRDRNVGIISAALLTVSYFGIFFSQEARAYSMVLFVFSLVLLFYLRALRTNVLSDWVLFGFFSAVAIWTHYYSLIGIGVIYLHAIITLRTKIRQDLRELKNPLIGLGVMTIIGLPLLVVVVQRYFALTSSLPTYGVLGPILIQETIVRFSGGYSSFSGLVAVAYIALMIVGFILLFSEDRNKTLLCGMLLVLPLVISIILSSKMTMNPRYLIYLLPVYFSMIAMAFPFLYKLIPNRNLVCAAVLVIFLINAPLLTEYYSSYVKEDWRGFAGIIGSKTQDGDLVVLVPSYMSQPFNYYYSNVTDRTIENGVYTGSELDSLYKTKGNGTMYLVVTGDISAANPQGDALAWMNEHTKIIDQRTGIYLLVAG